MRPEEALRLAAGFIREGGLSQGNPKGSARDANGREVPLWVTGSSETGRARPNENAVRFTIYGAIVKAIHASPDGVRRQALIFDVALRVALRRLTVPTGGNNYVQAVEQYNETPGLTAEDAAGFLEECANQCEAIGDGPYDPPIDTREGETLAKTVELMPAGAEGRAGAMGGGTG